MKRAELTKIAAKTSEDQDFYMALGALVRARRAQIDWQQDHLCALIGYSQPIVSRIENGTYQPDMDTIERLSHTLRFNLWALAGDVQRTMRRILKLAAFKSIKSPQALDSLALFCAKNALPGNACRRR